MEAAVSPPRLDVTAAIARAQGVGQACEVKITDQSVLNTHFHMHGWHALPLGYNVPHAVYAAADSANASWRLGTSIVHFSGKPKPWETAGADRRGRRAARGQAFKAAVRDWHATCNAATQHERE